MLDLTRLHSGNSELYRPRPVEKKAAIVWKGATYALSWGEQSFEGPHVRVGEGNDAYGADISIFFATHEPVVAKPDHYVKTAAVRAVRVRDSMQIETRVRQRLEAQATIQPGGWLIQNPDGELYYNSAEEFALRYEPLPVDERPSTPTLAQHLAPGGPKRILALDGGGIRGRITLGILAGVERVLGAPLCDHFDLIGGTSTGAIIATGLALGWPVAKLTRLYDGLGADVFRSEFWRLGLWRAKFPAEPLERVLTAEFGDRRLGSPDVKTGLCIVTKRLDSNSVWPLHNNPRGQYFNDPAVGSSYVPNKNYLLRQLVRASAAAPHYFDPERIAVSTGVDGKAVEGAFIDGGASPHNNPSLQLLLLATLKGYGFEWPLGADRLQVVSIGTGSWQVRHAAADVASKPAVETALLSLLSIMDDCSALSELVLQWLSDSPTARSLDSEIGALAGDLLGGLDPWVSYLRYNAELETEWLTQKLPETRIDGRALLGLRRMDSPASLELLAKIGDAAGSLVLPEHFAAAPRAT
jgi:uncharacterized protein